MLVVKAIKNDENRTVTIPESFLDKRSIVACNCTGCIERARDNALVEFMTEWGYKIVSIDKEGV